MCFDVRLGKGLRERVGDPTRCASPLLPTRAHTCRQGGIGRRRGRVVVAVDGIGALHTCGVRNVADGTFIAREVCEADAARTHARRVDSIRRRGHCMAIAMRS